MMIFRIGLLFLLLGTWISPQVLAQIELRAIPQSPSRSQASPLFNARVDSLIQDSIFVTLPFIEDFSSTRGRFPDSTKWEVGGGTHINNEMGDSPPSLNMATFDGFDANGQPYDIRNPTSIDVTDVLTSRYIDLDTLTVLDQVLLTFYWQLQGAGERPDLRDFLQLQFKDSADNWVTQWQRQGGDTIASPFTQEAFYVDEERFFHEDFQFRFRAQGRRSGSFDVWNLDYIVLDTARDQTEPNSLDIAGNRNINDYLSVQYTAVPFDHFFADKAAFIETDSLEALVNNLDEVFNVIEYECEISDTVSGRSFGLIRVDSLLDQRNVFIDGSQRDLVLRAQPKIDIVSPNTVQTKMVIAREFRVSTGDEEDFIPTNDAITAYNTLDDYYAYDDGTAEFAAGVNQRFGKLAYRYTLAQPDTMTSVDFYFPSVGESIAGQTFNFFVWKTIDTALVDPQDEVLYQEEIAFESSEGINQFTRHFFREPIPVSGSIYIGWQQLGEEFLVAGLDRNTDSGDQVFFNVANRWEQNTTIKGSLLLRPSFGEFIVSGTNEETPEITDNWVVYPNPTRTSFRVKHTEGNKVDEIRLYDLNGRLLKTTTQNTEIRVSDVPAGLYLVKIISQGKVFSRKLIIQP